MKKMPQVILFMFTFCVASFSTNAYEVVTSKDMKNVFSAVVPFQNYSVLLPNSDYFVQPNPCLEGTHPKMESDPGRLCKNGNCPGICTTVAGSDIQACCVDN